jgi:accessory gene regulator B
MIEQIAEHITNIFVHNKVISKEDKEIYLFGMEQMIIFILDMVSILILGMIFSEILASIIIAFSFMCLRRYAGGYHATTLGRCYFITMFMIAISLSVVKFVDFNILQSVIIMMLSGFVIFILTPVENKNKCLDDVEKIVYRKKGVLILGMEILLAIIGTLINLYEFVKLKIHYA